MAKRSQFTIIHVYRGFCSYRVQHACWKCGLVVWFADKMRAVVVMPKGVTAEWKVPLIKALLNALAFLIISPSTEA